MLHTSLELILARHCAPTLLGVKAASLASVSQDEIPDLEELAARCDRQFAHRGLRFRVLCQCRHRRLLYVYRPALLMRALQRPEAKAILEANGYPQTTELETLLQHLQQRLAEQRDFPHEIGLFLDYPAEDVRAFIETGGKGFRLSGLWKVYHDPEMAQARFACYDRCRECLCAMVAAGESITRLLGAA